MTGFYPEVGEITYNAAEQAFQARVTLTSSSDSFVYGVSVQGGLTMPTSVAELLLAAEATACHREKRGIRLYRSDEITGSDTHDQPYWQQSKAA